MRYSSRFFLYAPFAALLCLALAAAIYWSISAAALSRRLDAINGKEIAPGIRIAFATKALGGFPFRLDAILTGLRLDIAEVNGPVEWTAENFALHRFTYGPVQAILEAAGRQTVSWRGANGAQRRFVFLPGVFRGSAILRNGALQRFDCQIVDLGGNGFRAGDAQFHLRSTAHGVDLYVALKDVSVDGGYAAALGPDIQALTADASLTHTAALEKLLAGDESPVAALENWRRSGGTIVVKTLALTRRNRTLTFHGTLTLDSKHRLTGVLTGKHDAGALLRFEPDRMTLGSTSARR